MGRPKFVGQGERTKTVINGKGGNFHNGIVNGKSCGGQQGPTGPFGKVEDVGGKKALISLGVMVPLEFHSSKGNVNFDESLFLE